MSHRPNDSEEMDSNPESEEYETISYAIECEELEGIIDGEKIPQECKVAIQNKEDKPVPQVSTTEMREVQQADPTISQVVQWVKVGNRPKLSQIRKVK